MHAYQLYFCLIKSFAFQGVLEDFDKSKDATVTVPTAVPGEELLSNDDMMK